MLIDSLDTTVGEDVKPLDDLTMEDRMIVAIAQAKYRHHVEVMKLHAKLGIDDSHIDYCNECSPKR